MAKYKSLRKGPEILKSLLSTLSKWTLKHQSINNLADFTKSKIKLTK